MPLVRKTPTGTLTAATPIWPLLSTTDYVPAAGAVLVPLDTWLAGRDVLRARPQTGVWLAAGDDPAALAADLGTLAVVAVRFAAFNDGRGYSQAHLLRERHGFTGELRAVGDVLVDQAGFLTRAGFDAFQVHEGTDLDRFGAALHRFSGVYQRAADGAVPIIDRRHTSLGRAAE